MIQPLLSTTRAAVFAVGFALAAVACAPATTSESSSAGTAPPTTAPSTTQAPGPGGNAEVDDFIREITDWPAIVGDPRPLGRTSIGEPSEPVETTLDVTSTDENGDEVAQREAYVCASQD